MSHPPCSPSGPAAIEATDPKGASPAALPGRRDVPKTLDAAPSEQNVVQVELTLNGQSTRLRFDSRATLLDVLRERLGLTGTKKGCDHGSCGACTVHVDGQRVLSCLTLAATLADAEVTTIEGLADGDELHPMQQAFLRCDAYQCGYCTPGQIMSAVACLDEGHAGGTEEEAREWMSGNLCRCGAYPNIVAAVRQQSGHRKVGDPSEAVVVLSGREALEDAVPS